MIVIDIGCGRYGGDYSIERLIDEFHPDVLYGFDPNQGPDEYPWVPNPSNGPTGPTKVTSILIEKKAAWTYDGEIGFLEDGLNSCLTYREDAPKVPCIDLARFIHEIGGFDYRVPDPNDMDGEKWDDEEIVLKMDAEGSEYDLLPHLILTGADELLQLAIIEWHERGIERAQDRRRVIEKEFACPIREWPW